MSLKLHSVTNGKTPAEEFVFLNTTEAVNLKGYAIVDRTFDSSNNVSNEFRHIYVFPNYQIEKDDWVLIKTGTGTNSKAKMKDRDGILHTFYWGAKECVWNNNGGDRATLIKYSVINGVDVPAVK